MCRNSFHSILFFREEDAFFFADHRMKSLRLFLASVLCACSLGAQSFREFVQRVEALPAAQRSATTDSFLLAQKRFPPVADTTAMFVYQGTANVVTVAGDHSGWAQKDSMRNIAGTTFWYCIKTFPRDARLDYKYVVNGSTWVLDAKNPKQVSGGFGPNSSLEMPDYSAPEEIVSRSTVAKGRFIDTTFGSGSIAKRTVRMYLPPGFDASSARFPVVLFHDGLDYWNLGSVGTILDNLIADKKIMPLIAVFVPAQDRVPEYRTTKRDAYMSFICDTVMGYVQRRFPTIESPRFRAVIGASDGGHCALYQGVMRPDVFGNIGAQSSNVTSLITDRLKADPRLTTDFHLDIGMFDIPQLIPLVRNLRSLLDTRQYAHAYKEVNEGHSWGNWRARVGAILMRFFPLGTSAVPDDGSPSSSVTATLEVMAMPLRAGEPLRFRTSLHGHVRIRVCDLHGRYVHTANAFSDGSTSVDVSAWTPDAGMYIVAVSSDAGTVSRPFIVHP